MTTSGTISDAFSFCKSIVNCDKNILIASLLQGNDSIGWFVRSGTPIPNEDATAVKVVQTQLVTSIVKENETYLGKVGYILVHQELADVILFPRANKTVLCIVVVRPYDLKPLIDRISSSFDFLYHKS